VARDDTSTGVVSSANPSVYGQSITFTATVTASAPGSGTPSGTVQFKIGGINFGTPVALASGSAVSSANGSLSLAGHNVTAVYSGSVSYNASTSEVLSQTVNQAVTVTAVTSSESPSYYGHLVTLTASVAAASPAAGAPTGTVIFKDGADTLGTVNLDAGQAVYATANLSAGTHTINAIYSGDTHFLTSTGVFVQTTEILVVVTAGGGGGGGPAPSRTPTPTPTPTTTPTPSVTPEFTPVATPAAKPTQPAATNPSGQADVFTVALLGSESHVAVNGQSGTNADTSATSASNITLQVTQGTIARSPEGLPVNKITVNTLDQVAPPPANTSILKAFDFGPSGTTFSQPLVLTMSYNPSSLPAGAIENNLYIATWDGNSWIALSCTVDKVAHTVTARVNHFSQYVLLVQKAAAASPVITGPAAGLQTSTAAVAAVSPASTPSAAPYNMALFIFIIIAALSILFFIILLRRRKKADQEDNSQV
jgi:hypothetical protein